VPVSVEELASEAPNHNRSGSQATFWTYAWVGLGAFRDEPSYP
jgi:hypothetical protein